jgi:O-antigen/teichoic acid export membrane protein
MLSVTVNIRPWLVKFFINTEAVAIYSVAESIFGAVKTLIPTSTLSVLIPAGVSDEKRRERLLLRGTKYYIIAGMILGVLSVVIVPPFVSSFLPDYEPSVPLFILLLLALPFLGFRVVGAQFMIALRKQKFIFAVNIVKIIAGVVLPVVLLYLFGLWGMAIERILVAAIIGAVYYGYLVRSEIDVRDWRTLVTFNAEDRKFVRSAWGFFVTYLRGIVGKYRPH